MKTKLYLIIVPALLVTLWLTSCAVPPTNGADPLDRPGDEKSAATLHEENVQVITSNPGYRLP